MGSECGKEIERKEKEIGNCGLKTSGGKAIDIEKM